MAANPSGGLHLAGSRLPLGVSSLSYLLPREAPVADPPAVSEPARLSRIDRAGTRPLCRVPNRNWGPTPGPMP
ncbi:hypothetical protein GCM10009744_13160 [Kribbella alba]|uniref:Uncharacterized protein n=1 Tax=Kribbella alba TaxID=190197 RepID=A0ABN2F2J1_9ACTN